MAHTSESLQQAFAYLFPNEVQALKELAQSLPPNPVVVNIGAGAGTSGLAFMESRDDLELVTIDIQKEDSPMGCLYAEEKVLNQAGLLDWDRYTQYHIDSKIAGENWGKFFDDKVDLVFIDGNHSYNGCKGDILAWLPNIKPNGIMAVHDFEKKKRWEQGNIPDKAPHPLPWPGVDRAVRHYLCPYYKIIMHIDTLIAFEVK